MSSQAIDPLILSAWLSARSIARNLPAPVPDYGGFRVDTNSDAEIARWVFAKSGPGLEELARSISEPRLFLKLCGAADELRAALPRGWDLYPQSYFMQATDWPPTRRLADGYSMEAKRVGMAVEVRIFAETGALAASGYAADGPGVFVYDRIVTEPGHRRKGLGYALMQTLHDARQHPGSAELLVATEEGQALYSTMGWETISPYSTASVATL